MAGSAGRRNILREIVSIANGNNGAASPLNDRSFNPMSPDETLIRQRGCRKKSPTYNYAAPDPIFFKTPTKSPKKTHTRFCTPTKTPVRSSPRKRLNATPDKLGFNESGISELAISCRQPKRKRLSNVKPDMVLEKGLKALSHAQLVELVTGAANCSPEMKQVIDNLLPVPDLTPAEEQLIKLKHNVYKAYPRNVWGSQDSSFCYSRVKTHLEVYKKECLEICSQFMDSQHWPAVFEFIFLAWKLTLELPDWDNATHNKIKSICMKQLAAQCITALKKSNLDKSALSEVIERMEDFTCESAVKTCIAFATDLMKELA